jgi:hypothetical protein
MNTEGAMLIATFNATTGWVGKAITFENEQFALEGVGPLSATDVLSYDDQGFLEWANDGNRAWVESRAAAARPANGATTNAAGGSTLASGWAKLAASAGVASAAVSKAAESAKVSFSEGRAAAQAKDDSVPGSPEASPSALEPMPVAEPMAVVEEPDAPSAAQTAETVASAPIEPLAPDPEPPENPG